MIFGGIDNYLILLDLINKNIIGKVVEKRLDDVYIIVNKNIILFDLNGVFVISGIRFGILVVIIRGMKEEDMVIIVEVIDLCLIYDEEFKVRILVVGLIEKYFLYEEYNIMD